MMTPSLLGVSFSTPLILSLVMGGIFVGCFSFAVFSRLLGVLQQEHYRGGAFLKWYFRRGNITRQRVELLSLALLLLLALFNVCFSFLGYRGANLTALAPFFFLFMAYYLIQEKHALKVKTNVTPRLLRLAICTFLVSSAFGVGLCFALCALAAAIDADWFYLLRFVPVALVPLFTPLLVALGNALMCVYEVPHGKSFVKKAKKKLQNSPCVKVGVTGSFGKTSVKNFAATILSEKFKVIATPASFNTPLGIARTVNEQGVDCDIFLAEMGARHTGDIRELCDMVSPEYGVVTGVCAQHLETFGSLENIKREKGVLAARSKHVVLGESAQDMCEANGDALVYGRDFAAENIKLGTDGTRFELRIKDVAVPVKTRLLGRHCAEDIALAAALCYSLGMTVGEIAGGIERIEPVEHRLQLLHGANGVNVLDDAYNSNVEGAKCAVEVLRLFEGEKYVVTPGLVELGELEAEENQKLGAQLVGLHVVLVGETLVRAVRDGYLAAGGDEAQLVTVPTLNKAQEWLAGRLNAGDCVLFLNDLPDTY